MTAWSKRLLTLGKVVTFDYPYMLAGRRAPDRLPKLIDAHRQALRAATHKHHGKVVFVGKSMGGRVGCHLALEEQASSVVCMGYPLKGMGPKGKLRDEVLLALKTKILFVQGTRDSLCPLPLLEQVRSKMSAKNSLYVVESGDHSLVATKTQLKQSQQSQEDVDQGILKAISEFVA
jgi:predicted alpha/beta-hydrolase family hydrolase